MGRGGAGRQCPGEVGVAGAEVISWGICLLSSRGGCGVGTGGHSPAGSALAPHCPTWNQALCPSNSHPLWGSYSHLGAQSPGSFPMLARPTPHPPTLQTDVSSSTSPLHLVLDLPPPHPTTWLTRFPSTAPGIHHFPPDIRACTPLPCPLPRYHACHTPIKRSISERACSSRKRGIGLPKPCSLTSPFWGLWQQHEGCWLPGPHPGERPGLRTPVGWALVIHRPLTAPPPQLWP